jgi:hypothetical protein
LALATVGLKSRNIVFMGASKSRVEELIHYEVCLVVELLHVCAQRRFGPPVEELIAQEQRLSHSYGGRSVFGWEHPPKDCADANDIQASTRPSKCSERLSK